jgi:recombination protein RecT
MSNALTLVTSDIQSTKDEFQNLLADNSIRFEQEAGFAIQILRNNDYALSVAARNRDSVIAAVKNLAAIGISLNPAKKQAYLVPRSMGRDKPAAICLDISYMGLMDLAMATGSIKWAQAEIVRENDGFARGRFDEPPQHTFNPFSRDRGAIIGVYVVVKTADGDYLTHTMTYEDALAIRNRSEAWKAYVAGKTKSGGPWQSDETEMIKKTCVKQAYKYWPKTERLEQAIHHLNTEGGEGMKDINERPEPEVSVEPYIAAAIKTTTDAAALQYWRDNNATFAGQPTEHKRLKDAIAIHREQLKAKAESNTIEQPMAEISEPPVGDAPDAEFIAGLAAGEQT